MNEVCGRGAAVSDCKLGQRKSCTRVGEEARRVNGWAGIEPQAAARVISSSAISLIAQHDARHIQALGMVFPVWIRLLGLLGARSEIHSSSTQHEYAWTPVR